MNTKSQSHYSATSLRIRSGIVAAALSLLACQQVSAADGTVIGELAETMAPGQWAELVSTGADNAFSASDSIFEYCDKIIWDPVGRQLLFYGTSDPAGSGDRKFIRYSAVTNTWEILPLPPFAGGVIQHSYKQHAIDVLGRRMYYRPMGSGNTEFWSIDLDNLAGGWTRRADIGGLQYIDGAVAMDFRPSSQTVVLHTGDAGTAAGGSGLTEYNPATNSWRMLSDSIRPEGGLHALIECSPMVDNCLIGGGDRTNELWKLLPDNSVVSLGGNHPINEIDVRYANTTVDPTSGHYLMMSRDDEFYELDANDNSWTLIDSGASVPPFSGYSSAESTFHMSATPISNYGVVLYVQYRDGGNSKVWLYKHSPGTGTPPPNTGSNTFEEVCALTTTVNCWGFEDDSELYYFWPGAGDAYLNNHVNGRHDFGLNRQTLGNVLSNADNAAGQYSYPLPDQSIAEFPGGRSLKFTMLSQSAQKVSGDFTPVFKRFGTPGNYRFVRFGPGGEFWVRFAMYQSPELLSTVLRDGSGGGFGGVKRLIIHGYESSENLEETIIDGWQRRLPSMYSDSGSEDYGVQNHIGCFPQNPDVASSYSEPPCRKFQANVWQVYQVHVIVAPNGNDGLVELYVDDEDEPIIRVTNANQSGATGPAYTEDALLDVGNGYGKLSFTLFSTRKDETQVHPEAFMWIDNVVISRTRVPALSGNGTPVIRSMPPGTLR